MSIYTTAAKAYIKIQVMNSLPISKWKSILDSVYNGNIPEDATIGKAIDYYVEKFPDFEKRSKSTGDENYKKLTEDFMSFINEQK